MKLWNGYAMESNNILERLADEVYQRSVNRCGTCRGETVCEYHNGYDAGINALIHAIESELAKVGYVGT